MTTDEYLNQRITEMQTGNNALNSMHEYKELTAKGLDAVPKSAWHKVERADDLPSEEGKEYLLRLSSYYDDARYVFEELFFNEVDGVFFFNYDWYDIKAWCDPEEIV